MMFKILDIEPFFNDTDEPSVKHIDLSELDKSAFNIGSHVPEEIVSCIKGLKHDPEFCYVHVIALSADEFYGPNLNGDSFPEKDLLGIQDTDEASKNPEPYKGAPLPRYKTFLSAKFFKHHINKPDSPSYGDVVCSAYNQKMHRVELVIRATKSQCPDFCDKVERGIAVPLSMGMKIPWDECSICGKKSKRREEYCVHLKTMMRQIFPDGRQVKAINRKSRYFDISEVTIPADSVASTLSKVAGDIGYDPSEYYEDDMITLAEVMKNSEIDKKIPATTIGDAVKNVNKKLMGNVSNLSDKEIDISDKDIESASDFPLKDILSTLTTMGMVLKPQEHRKIIIIKIQKNPDFLVKESSGLKVDFIDPSIYNIFCKYAGDRSCYTDYLVKRENALSKNACLSKDITSDVISDCLYEGYRKSINELDAEKLACSIDKLYNLEGQFEKDAVHWTVPAAAVPLSAAYMYGAHQDYKRRYEGKPLGEFETMMADKPGKLGAGGSLGAVAATHMIRRNKELFKNVAKKIRI